MLPNLPIARKIALLMLAAAGIAGHLGGKLVFAARQ